MNMSEACQWDELLAQTTGYEHTLVQSALQERIHNCSLRMSEYEEASTDDRLWTWHSTDMGAYLEWTVRCDGTLYMGGTCSWGEGTAFDIDIQYLREDIDCPELIEDRIQESWFATPFGGPFDWVGGLFCDDYIDEEDIRESTDEEIDAWFAAECESD